MDDIKDVISVNIDLDYPSLEKLNNDMDYCENCSRLLNDFAGYISELTAIIQYVYQSQVLKNKFPNISKTLMDIAKVEIYHYKLIGDAICKLGGYPKAINWKGSPWSGSFPNYTNDLRDMLNNNISTEEQSIEQYKYHRIVMKNKILQKLFDRIVLDEEKHISIFKEILNHVEEKDK